jgi:hypothetical protein
VSRTRQTSSPRRHDKRPVDSNRVGDENPAQGQFGFAILSPALCEFALEIPILNLDSRFLRQKLSLFSAKSS